MTLLRQLPAVARRIAALAAIALAGCGDDPVDLAPVSITVTPASITAVPGDTVRVRVTTSGGGMITPLVLGSSSAVARVDANGLVTAVSPGTSVITATFDYNGQRVTGTIPVTVLGLSLEPTQATIAVGGTVFLRPTFIGDFSRYGGIRWSSSDSSVASVDAGGLVRGLRGGVARIAVFAANEPRLRGEATVTVQCLAQLPGSLTVVPTSVALQTGATQRLEVAGTTGGGVCGGPVTVVRDFIFRSSDTTVATVSADGVITARRGGTAVVTVALGPIPSVTQSVQVTVRDPISGPAVSIRSITTGDPPTPANLDAVRGTVAVTINLRPDAIVGPARVELRLAGRSAAVQQLPAAPAGSLDFRTATLTVNTAARDAATNAALYPNGVQTLEVVVEWGCVGATLPCVPQSATVQQRLTLANP